MKSVVKEYGAVIVAIMAAVAVFAIVCGQEAAINIYESMNEDNPIVEKDYTIYADMQAASRVIDRERPKIQFCMYQENGEHRTIRAGEQVKLADYFSAVSMEGMDLTPVILSVSKEDGQILTIDEQGEVTFPTSGIYIVRVMAADDECVARTVDIQIPVMRGEGRIEHETGSVGSRGEYHYYLCDSHYDDCAWAFA